MAVITIDTLISKVDNEITRLEKLNSINVTVRIDDTVDFLKDVLFDTKAIKGDQKFDLIETIGENCTAVYELNGDVITAGSNVLTYGDELTITITADTGYTINAFTINDVSYTLGDTVEKTLTVVDNLEVVASAELKTFNLVTTPDANCLITVTKDEEQIVAGTDVLTYGDIITITATANEGYDIESLEVNGEAFTSGETYTVEDNVTIVATSTAKTYDLTSTPDANCTISVTRNGDEVVAGTDVISYDDVLVITATANEGYDAETLEVNGEAFTSGDTYTVEGNVTIIATSIAKTYDLTSTPDANCTILVTRNGDEVVAGTDVLTYGDIITITSTANEDYEILTLQVNSVDFTSGEEHEVVGDVVITATSQLI